MNVPTIPSVSDERLQSLQFLVTGMLQAGRSGFANNILWMDELAALIIEVRQSRKGA